MSRSPIDLVHLSDHDRYVANVQLARAEALADAILCVAATIAAGFRAVSRNAPRRVSWDPHSAGSGFGRRSGGL